MRIIGGTHKGRSIHAPNNLPVRPTTDFAKESLFNILNNEIDFDGVDALDLFCGTGNITYELASRGCGHITSIDVNFKCTSFVKESIVKFNFENVMVMKANVFLYLKQCSRKFDFIFADPPYANPKINEIPDLIFNNNILNEGGMLVVEHPAEISFSMHPNFNKHKVYGHVNFTFFEHK